MWPTALNTFWVAPARLFRDSPTLAWLRQAWMRLRPMSLEEFIASLPLDEGARKKLRELNPRNYVGLAAKLVERFAPPAPKSGS